MSRVLLVKHHIISIANKKPVGFTYNFFIIKFLVQAGGSFKNSFLVESAISIIKSYYIICPCPSSSWRNAFSFKFSLMHFFVSPHQ